MSVRPENLSIINYPDPALRAKAAPVDSVDDGLRAIASRMLDLMHEARGIGLAAPQVGLSIRLFVANVPAPEDDDASDAGEHPESSDGPMVFVNPVIERFLGPPEPWEEGCLSLPEVRGDVRRPPEVVVRALNERGEEFTIHAAGLLARCIQHEIDHLDGVLIIDKFVPTARLRNRSAVRDLERAAGRR